MKLLKGYKFSEYQANVIWLGAEKVIRVLFSLIATVFVARKLGVEKFGALNYIFSLVLVVSTISNLGQENLLGREIHLQPNAMRAIIKRGLLLKFLCLAICFILIFSYLTFVSINISEDERAILLPFSLVLLLSVFQIFEFTFMAISKSQFAVKSLFVGGIVANSVKILGLFMGYGLKFIAYSYVVEYIIISILMMYYTKREIPIDTEEPQKGTLKKLLSNSIPLLLSGLSITIYMRVDQVMLRSMMSLEEVGFYGAALKISESLYFLPIIITGSYFPKWVLAKSKNLNYLDSFKKIIAVLGLLSICFSIGTIILGKDFVQIVFGEHFLHTYEILRVHVFSLMFGFIGIAISKVLIVREQESRILHASVLGVFGNVLLNIFLIPRYGGVGAAFATLLSQLMSGVFFLFLFKNTRDLGYQVLSALKPSYLYRLIKSEELRSE